MRTLILISVALLVAILLFVYLGCACRKPWEGFQDAQQATKPSAAKHDDTAVPTAMPLTAKEKELFEDLKENRITDQRLSELIKNGTINEKVVTKFLNQLTSDAAAAAPASTKPAPTAAAPETFYAPAPRY